MSDALFSAGGTSQLSLDFRKLTSRGLSYFDMDHRKLITNGSCYFNLDHRKIIIRGTSGFKINGTTEINLSVDGISGFNLDHRKIIVHEKGTVTLDPRRITVNGTSFFKLDHRKLSFEGISEVKIAGSIITKFLSVLGTSFVKLDHRKLFLSGISGFNLRNNTLINGLIVKGVGNFSLDHRQLLIKGMGSFGLDHRKLTFNGFGHFSMLNGLTIHFNSFSASLLSQFNISGTHVLLAELLTPTNSFSTLSPVSYGRLEIEFSGISSFKINEVFVKVEKLSTIGASSLNLNGNGIYLNNLSTTSESFFLLIPFAYGCASGALSVDGVSALSLKPIVRAYPHLISSSFSYLNIDGNSIKYLNYKAAATSKIDIDGILIKDAKIETANLSYLEQQPRVISTSPIIFVTSSSAVLNGNSIKQAFIVVIAISKATFNNEPEIYVPYNEMLVKANSFLELNGSAIKQDRTKSLGNSLIKLFGRLVKRNGLSLITFSYSHISLEGKFQGELLVKGTSTLKLVGLNPAALNGFECSATSSLQLSPIIVSKTTLNVNGVSKLTVNGSSIKENTLMAIGFSNSRLTSTKIRRFTLKCTGFSKSSINAIQTHYQTITTIGTGYSRLYSIAPSDMTVSAVGTFKCMGTVTSFGNIVTSATSTMFLSSKVGAIASLGVRGISLFSLMPVSKQDIVFTGESSFKLCGYIPVYCEIKTMSTSTAAFNAKWFEHSKPPSGVNLLDGNVNIKQIGGKINMRPLDGKIILKQHKASG